GTTSKVMKSPRFLRPASYSFASSRRVSPRCGGPRPSWWALVRGVARGRVLASAWPRLRARGRCGRGSETNTRSCRLRANSAPVLADEHRRGPGPWSRWCSSTPSVTPAVLRAYERGPTMMVKKLSAIGNSLGFIIERPILELLDITKDTPLEVRTDG